MWSFGCRRGWLRIRGCCWLDIMGWGRRLTWVVFETCKGDSLEGQKKGSRDGSLQVKEILGWLSSAGPPIWRTANVKINVVLSMSRLAKNRNQTKSSFLFEFLVNGAQHGCPELLARPSAIDCHFQQSDNHIPAFASLKREANPSSHYSVKGPFSDPSHRDNPPQTFPFPAFVNEHQTLQLHLCVHLCSVHPDNQETSLVDPSPPTSQPAGSAGKRR